MKTKDIYVEIIDLQLLVHPNEMAFRKRGHLGMEPVLTHKIRVLITESFILYIYERFYNVHCIFPSILTYS